MSFRAMLKTVVIRSLPAVFWKSYLKSYYLHRLKSYSRTDGIIKAENDLEVVKYIINVGDAVFDVGANFGFYTLYLSKYVGDQGQVYSIEPIPLTFEILSNNVKKMPLNNVLLFNCGISDKESSGTMEIPTYDSGGQNFYQARIIKEKKSNPSFRDCVVDLKSLDSFLPSVKKSIRFIKIDVEGHELQVILGATQLIERFRPAFLIEVSGNPDERDTTASRLVRLLNQKGYSPYWYNGVKVMKRSPGDKSMNYFFLTDEQHKNIQARMI
jgi:FkbM family methyltransferase